LAQAIWGSSKKLKPVCLKLSSSPEDLASNRHWSGGTMAEVSQESFQELQQQMEVQRDTFQEIQQGMETDQKELVRQLEIQQEQIRELQADALSKDQRLTASTKPPSQVRSGFEGEALEQMEAGMRGNAQQSVEDSKGNAVSTRRITPERLDEGHSYQLNTSIWDSMLFCGYPGLGWSVSIATLFAGICNFCLQFAFCYMIWAYMLDPEVNSSTLDTLLKFRLSIAHNVEYADPITKQSLAQQLCNTDDKVHYAAGQLSMLKDVKTFLGGSGVQLMIIAEILFLCVIVQELDRIVQFANAIMSLRRSAETRVVLVDSSEHEDRCKAEDPYEFSVETRIEEITPLRVYFAWACIVVPRLFIVLYLAVTGVRFIGKTHSVDDLVLNCVAIAFVMDFDEIAFEGFAPRRVQTLVSKMKPIPCVAASYHVSRPHGPVLWQITKILLVLASAVALYYLSLARFFWQLQQVDHVLCSQSSTLDFVYARNSANNIIYVARAQDSNGWTPDEVTMMNVANLKIEPKYDWNSGILDKQNELGFSNELDSPAIVIGSTATSVGDTEYDAIKYEAILELGSMSLEQAASSITCRDLGSSKERGSYLAALQVLMENTSIESCDDVSWHYCTRREMAQLRALCPVRCSCHVPPTYELLGKKTLAGYFQSPQGGCPQSCQKQLETSNEISFVTGESPLARGSVGKCTDLGQDKFVSFGSADCLVDKTVASDCSDLPPEAFWWLTFVAGLFEHLTADVAFPDIVNDMVMQSGSHLDVPSNMKPEFVEWVSNGSMAQSLLDGSWDLMPGVPHPRGLTGCAYLTSFEVRSLLNTDLCSAEEYSSIRFMCPVSCGCTQGTIYMTEGLQVTDMSDIYFQVSNRMEDLGSCPAECVMVHPSISNDTSYDSITCTAHDDCSAGKFCYGGVCSACDECHYCSDGIDGTCGSCDGPTQEIGPCLTDGPDGGESTTAPACSDTSGGATGLFAAQGGFVVSCDVWAGYAEYCAYYSAAYDDSDFTATDMCCACGGGGAPQESDDDSQGTAPCVGDSSSWDAGYGGCDTYGPGGNNNAYCASDSLDGIFAKDVCYQCGSCALVSTPAPTPTP
jgi:hypothetical protein